MGGGEFVDDGGDGVEVGEVDVGVEAEVFEEGFPGEEYVGGGFVVGFVYFCIEVVDGFEEFVRLLWSPE